jgi:tRNA(adenine34) deaminase
MRLAIVEAARARSLGEVPIGAVVISPDSLLVGAGCNRPISVVDPTAHAEIDAIRAAAQETRNYRLTGCTLYVTVEPCLMCVGAMVHARIGLVVYGATEPKSGALVSAVRAHEAPGLNHRVEVIGGVLEDECRELMQDFFKSKRL